jgi:hypothetical protein
VRIKSSIKMWKVSGDISIRGRVRIPPLASIKKYLEFMKKE